MNYSFAPLRRTLAAVAFAGLLCGTAFAQSQAPAADPDGSVSAGGKYKDCHGYIEHVSATNMKVHCIDGNASNQSFVNLPHLAWFSSGKSVKTSTLAPGTLVHVVYTQGFGIKKISKIFVGDPSGNEKSG